ncbi:MAG: hypothetical protein K0S40_3267 [Actinomycetospora sp.]|nr:hypothetical protein [Actinomycetospora sp.]
MSEPVDAPPSDPPAGARVGGQQRQARALATRSAILAAAAEEFATASYHEASLSRILERSKVTKGALYFHFVSKESIASAVVDEMEVLCRDLVVRARSKERDPLCTAAQVAREVQDALAGPVLRAGQRLCSEGFAGPQRPGWPFTFWQDVFGGLFADAARAGLLAAGVDHAALSRRRHLRRRVRHVARGQRAARPRDARLPELGAPARRHRRPRLAAGVAGRWGHGRRPGTPPHRGVGGGGLRAVTYASSCSQRVRRCG